MRSTDDPSFKIPTFKIVVTSCWPWVPLSIMMKMRKSKAWVNLVHERIGLFNYQTTYTEFLYNYYLKNNNKQTMKINVTYDQLYSIEQDIARLRKESPALEVFLKPNFDYFLKETMVRRSRLHDNLKEIRRKYIEFDSNDMPMVTTKDPLHGKQEWVFKGGEVEIEGIMVDLETAYNKEVTAFLNISFEINY